MPTRAQHCLFPLCKHCVGSAWRTRSSKNLLQTRYAVSKSLSSNRGCGSFVASFPGTRGCSVVATSVASGRATGSAARGGPKGCCEDAVAPSACAAAPARVAASAAADACVAGSSRSGASPRRAPGASPRGLLGRAGTAGSSDGAFAALRCSSSPRGTCAVRSKACTAEALAAAPVGSSAAASSDHSESLEKSCGRSSFMNSSHSALSPSGAGSVPRLNECTTTPWTFTSARVQW